MFHEKFGQSSIIEPGFTIFTLHLLLLYLARIKHPYETPLKLPFNVPFIRNIKRDQ
jgi:hypothetical protein